MKTSEAVKLMEEGKKVMRADWAEDYPEGFTNYLYLEKTTGRIFNRLHECQVIDQYHTTSEWEEYIESELEIKKRKELYKKICGEK